MQRNRALERGLKELGENTTPTELQARGVSRVRTVKTQLLVQLVERAVEETLRDRTSATPAELTALQEMAHSRLETLMRVGEALEEAGLKMRASRREAARELARLRSKSWESIAEECADSLNRQERCGETLLEAARSALYETARKVSESTERDIDLLRRRIQKLSSAVESAEEQLREAHHKLSGIPSALHGTEDRKEAAGDPRRHGLMAQIFLSNHDLREDSPA